MWSSSVVHGKIFTYMIQYIQEGNTPKYMHFIAHTQYLHGREHSPWFRVAINKLFEWLFSRVLPPRRFVFDSRPSYASLGTSSLGWRWPYQSGDPDVSCPAWQWIRRLASAWCLGRWQMLCWCLLLDFQPINFIRVTTCIYPTLIKKKIKFSSYIRKFRVEQLQSHIWLTASSYIGKYMRISSYIRKPFLIYD